MKRKMFRVWDKRKKEFLTSELVAIIASELSSGQYVITYYSEYEDFDGKKICEGDILDIMSLLYIDDIKKDLEVKLINGEFVIGNGNVPLQSVLNYGEVYYVIGHVFEDCK